MPYSKVTPPADDTYGSAAEIANRDGVRGAPSGQTNFKQIGPDDQGGDADDPTFKHLSADLKFSKGIAH